MEELKVAREAFSRDFVDRFGPRAREVAVSQMVSAQIDDGGCASFWRDLILWIEADAQDIRALGEST
jgi:hypothetical protein